MTFSQF